MKKGIDISEHQTGLDYTRIAKQIDFVAIREGYRQTIDKMFLTHVAGFKALGTPIIAVYHFLYCTDAAGARAEAESCIRNVEKAGLPKTTRIFCDFEYDTVEKAEAKGIILGKAECMLFTKAFCETIEKAGYPTGIYTNGDYYVNYYEPSIFQKYPLWYAHYDASKPSKDCLIWQYSESGRLNYHPGKLDMDIYYDEKEQKLTEDLISDGISDQQKGVTMTTTEKAIQWMEALARNNSHGYDQIYRWGERGDYDCSSAVITAWQTAGVPVKSKGATYTGNMYNVFRACGFKDVTSKVSLSTGAGLKRGDVLLNHAHHVAMYCGNGQEVEASINEKGGARYGAPGDQTGREILIRNYRNYPWNAVLRYESTEEIISDGGSDTMFTVNQVKNGDRNASVLLLQKILKAMDYKGLNGSTLALDSDFGPNSEYAVKSYQGHNGLVVDGICGPATWGKLLAGLAK